MSIFIRIDPGIAKSTCPVINVQKIGLKGIILNSFAGILGYNILRINLIAGILSSKKNNPQQKGLKKVTRGRKIRADAAMTSFENIVIVSSE